MASSVALVDSDGWDRTVCAGCSASLRPHLGHGKGLLARAGCSDSPSGTRLHRADEPARTQAYPGHLLNKILQKSVLIVDSAITRGPPQRRPGEAHPEGARGRWWGPRGAPWAGRCGSQAWGPSEGRPGRHSVRTGSAEGPPSELVQCAQHGGPTEGPGNNLEFGRPLTKQLWSPPPSQLVSRREVFQMPSCPSQQTSL